MAVKGNQNAVKPIKAKEVYRLAKLGCSDQDIGSWFLCDGRTIRSRFACELRKGREDAKQRLRRLQWINAEKGNVAMQIWLGKQYLGQKEPQDENTTPDGLRETTSLLAQALVSLAGAGRATQ